MNVMKTTLVIMAAGIGSRFGGGIKQLAPVGPNGEIIMDYSIHDALEAGFNKIVFIIRRDLEKDFKEIIGNRIEKLCEVSYAFQETDNLPEGFTKPEGRTKPWGTGQAILACKGLVNEPFAIINADDYYGKEAYKLVHKYLTEDHKGDKKYNFCMAGFVLKHTLSDNGVVTRGICVENEEGYLVGVNETKNIGKTADGGAQVQNPDGNNIKLDENSRVSMNMWGVTPDFIDLLDEGFAEFLKENIDNLSSEYLLPTIIDGLISNKMADVKVLTTNDKWFGVTYKEDKETVTDAFKDLIKKGVYKEKLFD